MMEGISIGSVSVSVVPDTRDFVPKLDARLADIPDIGVKLRLDELDAMTRLDKFTAKLDEVGAASRTATIRVDTTAAEADLAKFKASMDAATAGGGASGGGGLSAAVKGALALSPALLGIGSALGAVAAGAAGAFAAVGAGIGAFALAAKPVISNINSAATAQEKYNTAVEQYGPKSTQAKTALAAMQIAMAQLSPSEKAAAENLASFKTAYEGWARSFDPQILPVFNNGLTILKRGMTDLSPVVRAAGTALGGVTAGIAASLASPDVKQGFQLLAVDVQKGIGSLGPVLANVVPAALNLFQALNPVTTIVEKFVTQLGPQLPALASSLSGPFKQLASTFAEIGPSVGQLLGGLGHIIGGVLSAVQPLVPVFLNLLDALVKMVLDSGALPFLEKLGGMIGQLLTAVSPLIPVIGQVAHILLDALGGALGTVVQALTPVINIIANSLGPILTPVAQLVASLAGSLGTLLADALKALLPVLTQLAPMLATIAKGLGAEIVEAVSKLLPAITPLIPVLGNAFLGILKAISPLLPPLVNLLGTALHSAVTALAPVFTTLVRALADLLPSLVPLIANLASGLVPVLKAITPILPELAKMFGSVLLEAVKLLVPVLQLVVEVMNAIPIPILLPLLASLVDPILGVAIAASELAGVWHTVWGEITKVTSDAWSAITGAFSDAWDWISKTFAGLWDGAKHIVTTPISDAVDAITGFFGSKGALQGAFNAVWDWLKNTWDTIWSGAKDVIGKPIDNAIGDITGWFGPKGGLQGAFNAVWDWLKNTWSAVWNGLKDLLTGPINEAVTTINTVLNDAKSGVGAIFSAAVSAVETAWNKIEAIAKAPVTFIVNTVLNDGLLAAWDDVVDIFDKGLHINPIQLPKGWATGGVLPGYAPGHDSVLAMLSPGEAVLRPEVARWLGADAIHGLNRAAASGGLPHFSGGGVWGDITGAASDVGSAISGAAGAVGGAIGDAAGWVKNHLNPLDWLKSAINGALGNLSKITGTTFGQMVASVPKKLGSDLLNYAKSLLGLGGGSGPGSGGAGVQQWAPQVLQALSLLGQPSSLLADVLHRMNQESGGNPTVVNTWDSNWAAGTPSVGLMQVIGPTFGAYAGPFAGTGPFSYGVSVDPLSNIYAGLNYALHNYPSIDYAMMKSGGYALGGIVGYDQGGWLQPGFTPVWNGTGAPEPVMNPQQWDAVKGNSAALEGKLDTLIELSRSNPEETAAGINTGIDSKLQAVIRNHADTAVQIYRQGGSTW